MGLAPEVVFHPAGYKGSSEKLIEIYRDGFVGVPLLQWMGLTLDRKRAAEASVAPFPQMIRWLREEAD
jgi:hypothetical protein